MIIAYHEQTVSMEGSGGGSSLCMATAASERQERQPESHRAVFLCNVVLLQALRRQDELANAACNGGETL